MTFFKTTRPAGRTWRTALWTAVGVLGWAGASGAAGSAQQVYDDLNRLVEVRYDNGAIHSYEYDEMGNRLDAGLRFEPASPDILVLFGEEALLHEAGRYDFGQFDLGASLSITLTITNTGEQDLLLTGTSPVAIVGDQAADFTILQQPETTIAPGASTSFELRFAPTGRGARRASLSIDNNDVNEAPYTIRLAGDGPDPIENPSFLLWTK